MKPKQNVVPRAELHCHIEGAAPPTLVRRLAKRYDVDLGDLFDTNGNYSWHDFTTFIQQYDAAASLFRRPGDYAELAETYYKMLAAEGVIYAEVFISPDHAKKAGLTYHAYLEGLAAGFERAKADTGIEGRFIPLGVRHEGAESVEAAIKEVLDNPHPLVTGFGLAGDERVGRAKEFEKAFAMAREAGLGLTAHAGEFGGADSVREALDYLKITRIGHGVRAVEEDALVERLVAEDITLEVCPQSNIALGVYSNLRFHPVNLLRQAGVRITLNSDDPPFFRTTLGHEYVETSRVFGWSRDIQKSITKNALEAAFVDEATRSHLLKRLDTLTAEL